MATAAYDRDAILRAIADWPAEEQVTLARAILERATASRVAPAGGQATAETARQSTWDALYGIASNGQEPPTDEEVARWLDEHRMQKYGG